MSDLNKRHAKGRIGDRKYCSHNWTRAKRHSPRISRFTGTSVLLTIPFELFLSENPSSGSLKSFSIYSIPESPPFRREFTWSRCVYSTPSKLSAILCVLLGNPLRAVFSKLENFSATAKLFSLYAGTSRVPPRVLTVWAKTLRGQWWELAGSARERDTRVFPHHTRFLPHTHPTNSRLSIAIAVQGIDFGVVIIQQALEAIDEVGDLLKVKYSRRKIDAREWKQRQLSKERTINLERLPVLPD